MSCGHEWVAVMTIWLILYFPKVSDDKFSFLNQIVSYNQGIHSLCIAGM